MKKQRYTFTCSDALRSDGLRLAACNSFIAFILFSMSIVFSTVYADMSLSYCTILPINQSINQSFIHSFISIKHSYQSINQSNPIQSTNQPTNQSINPSVFICVTDETIHKCILLARYKHCTRKSAVKVIRNCLTPFHLFTTKLALHSASSEMLLKSSE